MYALTIYFWKLKLWEFENTIKKNLSLFHFPINSFLKYGFIMYALRE